jgi:hypothetical protein
MRYKCQIDDYLSHSNLFFHLSHTGSQKGRDLHDLSMINYEHILTLILLVSLFLKWKLPDSSPSNSQFIIMVFEYSSQSHQLNREKRLKFHTVQLHYYRVISRFQLL